MDSPIEIEIRVPLFQEVESRISLLWQRDAQKVADLLDNKPLCIVTGSYGIGKSYSLVRRLQQILDERKFATVKIKDNNPWILETEAGDVVEDDNIVSLIDGLGDTQKGVIIIDDAESISFEKEEFTREVLSTARNKGYAVVPVIAYGYTRPQERYSDIAVWRNCGKEITGFEPQVYNLSSKLLDPQLARDYLIAIGGDNRVTAPEAADFIVRILPLRIGLLRFFRGMGSVEEARREINLRYHHWYSDDNMVSLSQLRRIEKSLAIL